MMHKVKLALSLATIATFSGCNYVEPDKANPKSGNQAVVANANKTFTDQIAEKVFGTEKTGIPECDEILINIEQRARNSNDTSIQTRAMQELAKQRINSYVRDGLTNKTPQQRAEIAKQCRQFAETIRAENTNTK
ncbi:MAG: hypothetical protein H7Z37_12935 [Pyrinomonadaceae bacterium]|nr:hypothetical protein [Pyrinomonadaceae bacterium]